MWRPKYMFTADSGIRRLESKEQNSLSQKTTQLYLRKVPDLAVSASNPVTISVLVILLPSATITRLPTFFPDNL
jgi:hypothetical protein